MVGKLDWYHLGASSLSWAWVRRRMETAKAQARLERWRARTEERLVLAGTLILVSGFGGFPPLAITAVIGGVAWLSRLLG